MSDLEVLVPDQVPDQDPDQDYTGSRYENIKTIFEPPRPPIVFRIDERDYNCEYNLEHFQEYIYTICNDDGPDMTVGEEGVFRDEHLILCEINQRYESGTFSRIGEKERDIAEKNAYDKIKQASQYSTPIYKGKENYYIELCNGSTCVKKDSKIKVLDKALSIANGTNFKGGVGNIRRYNTVSNHTGKNAFQSRGTPGHVKFFWHIWNHFAPSRSRQIDPQHPLTGHPSGDNRIYIKMPIYHTDGRFICNILLRRNLNSGNTIYSVLFEFTNLIHWSIFYSHCDANVADYQVSQFHFTINPFSRSPKKRIFFEYTSYIDSQVNREEGVMGVVSQLMIRAMYQLVSGRSRGTDFIMDADFMGLRTTIDEAGFNVSTNNQLTNIARQHIDLVYMIQHVLGGSDFGLNDIIHDILTLSAPAGGAAAGPAGGKNINRYLTKINNIKERLKLLKKNKVKNKVKITKLSKSIEELKAKLKKQKEKEKAKLKKQKEKEKAKLKKQKEKENVKRKKTKAKKS